MKDVRFYLEFPTRTAKKRSGKAHVGHWGNVFAAFIGNTHYQQSGECMQEGLGAVHPWPNSPVASTSASAGFLSQCKRIPERTARQIHPLLFERLDQE